jgi:hypothetical protein
MKWRFLYVVLFTLCLCWGYRVQAATYLLSPGDDIQGTIDAAATGDTLQFTPGVYTVTDQLDIVDKGLTLTGLGKAAGTIIQRNGGADHRIFYIGNSTPGTYSPANATVIDGFTIRNGRATGGGLDSNGGNISVVESPYTVIQNSIIENGFAGVYGGGIDMQVGGKLVNSVVRNNATADGSLNQGGGVYSRYGGNTIENTIIYNNWADVGGGVAIQNSGIDNDSALGGADSRTRLINVTIADNHADGYSGFIFGGGVGSQLQGKTAFITDSIVWDNDLDDIYNITIAGGGTLIVDYTNFELASFSSGSGNITSNPLFEAFGSDPWDYYRLQAGSPALTGSSTGGIMGAVLNQSTFAVPSPAAAWIGLSLLGGLLGLRRRR